MAIENLSFSDLHTRVEFTGSTDHEYYSDKIDIFDFLLEPNYTNNCVFVTEDGERLSIEYVTQEGGGEGGTEYCFTVIKIGDEYFKIEYSYYSHQGYDTDYATITKVTPVGRTVIFYE